MDIEKYNEAMQLVSTLESSFLELGRVLREAQKGGGTLFDSMKALPGLGKRRAYYLIEIDRVFSPLAIDKTDLARIGWTKLKTIAKHVTQDNVQAMLGLAKSHTEHQLRALVAGRTPIKNARVVLIYLTQAQHAAYVAALVKHGATVRDGSLKGHVPALMKMIKKLA